MYRLFPIVSALALVSAGSISVIAQGIQTGTVSGSVTDATGAAVPGATIVIVDLARGTSFTATAQSDGNFNFQALPVGTYKVTITSGSFSPDVVPDVAVTAGNDRSLGKQTLGIGTQSTSVEVEAGNSAELNTTQAQVSASFSTQALESLPLGNGFDEVALLVPGVVQTHDLSFSNSNGASFSSNGARGRDNNFELDGQSNNDNSVAGPQIFFGNQDAIAEIQVVQSNFSAQYGRDTGTIINYITKSGTNSFHGSAFEFYTGSFLSSYPNQDKNPILGYCASGQTPAADGCTAVARLPRSVDNKYGGTLGGPIIKDKLWAFGSTYFQHTRNGSQPFTSSASGLTPTPAGISALLAAYPNNPGVLILKNGGPYSIASGNPQPVLNAATSEQIQVGTGPVVNVQVAPITRTAPSGNYADQEDMGRLDYQFTPKDRFFLRYFYQSSNSSNEPFYGPAGTFYDVPDKNYSIGADFTHTFSPRWLNQLRYSYQESKLDFQGGSLPDCTVNTLTACPGYISFGGNDLSFGQATNLPQGRTVKVTQVQNNVSFTRGKQTILFGGEFDYQNSPNTFLPLYNGEGQFGSLNDFLNQNGNFLLANGNPLLPFSENDYALYFQDDYKVSSSLTLNIGLRWEFFGQAINKLHDLTVARESNSATAIWDPSLPVSARSTPSVASNYKNFEPRVGFAFNPSFDRKLVIRGGYSIGYDPAFYNIFLNVAEVAPVATSAEFDCAGNCLGNGTFTGAAFRAANLSKLPTGGNPAYADQEFVPNHFQNPYLETYSLGIEHQISNRMVATLRYVGTHGVALFQSIDANPYLATVQANFPAAAPAALCNTAGAPGIGRPNCGIGNQNLIANTAFSVYNSLQAAITTSNFHGFTGTANYTFSHATDNSSEIYSTGAGGNTISNSQNPLDINDGERGTSGFSLPQNFSLGMTYTVPQLSFGNNIIKKAANGFQVNAIYQASSGEPYNPYQPLLPLYGLDDSYCDTAFNSSTVGQGADTCRLVLSNKSAPIQTIALLQGGALTDLVSGNPVTASATHWIINNQDIANQLGTPYPGSGRNILRAQTYNNLDASIFKDTKFRDDIVVELQLNVYNALNRQFRGTPLANAFYDTGAVGPANPFLSNAYNSSEARQGIGTRNVQLGGKIRF